MASSSSASTVREPVHDGGEDGGGGTIEALISAGNEDNSHFSALFVSSYDEDALYAASGYAPVLIQELWSFPLFLLQDPLPFGSDAMEEDTAPVADSDLGASLRTPSSNQPLPSRNPGDQQSRRHWIVLFELLLLWLVASRSLSEKVCALLLDFLDGVARHLGDVRDDQSSRSTSGSGYGSRALAQRRSQLRSAQVKYYLCPDDSCWTPHSSVDSPRQCRKCGHDLFFDADFNAAPEQPRLVFHYDPIANWLEELLLRPGFEQQLNEWRSRPQTPGVYGDLYDGSWWKDKDASGSDFFTQNRLSISLALMIDWIKPFSRNGTSHYSCGVISLRIDNLPAHIRNHSHFTHVCCVLPGPKKPKAVALAAVMEILIVELRDLGTMGRRLQVHDHGQKTVDRLVRARVRRLMADTEARTLLAGFPHHSSSCQFCPWCTADQKTWLVRFFNGEQPVRRSSASHKSSAIRALSIARINPGSDRLDTIRKTEGATMTPLYSFPGWSSLEMAPVDVMHLLDLGLGRHTWMETLIGGKLLKGEELERSQEVLGETTYPSGLTRISPLLGNPSGGTPTSAGWSVLTRYLLPVLLVAAWRGLLLGSGVKTFSTTKRKLYARRDELDEEGQMIYVPFDDGGPNAHDENGPPPASMSSHANPSASGQPNSTGQSAAQFTREVRLINLLDATLQLAAASRLAHAHRLDAQQLMNLHEHLCTYVRIIATEINPAWTTYNFHIALHVADQIREHGPPRAYWSYPQERSYGIMKRPRLHFCSYDGILAYSLPSSTLVPRPQSSSPSLFRLFEYQRTVMAIGNTVEQAEFKTTASFVVSTVTRTDFHRPKMTLFEHEVMNTCGLNLLPDVISVSPRWPHHDADP
ncbi:hypothetical protein CF319_g590 [Tilletia indica]|nr:hypothetical protein CF319_g590 [Tilletia indica]